MLTLYSAYRSFEYDSKTPILGSSIIIVNLDIIFYDQLSSFFYFQRLAITVINILLI